MLTTKYISTKTPTFSSLDKSENVYFQVKDLGFSHIFIEKDSYYQYSIRTNLLMEHPNNILDDFLEREYFYISENNFTLDNICNLINNNCNVLPVLNENHKIIGHKTSDCILKELSNFNFFNNIGHYIVLEHENKEFSISKICQIIEDNNAKMLGFFISNHNTTHTQAHIKIESQSIERILNHFERYNYIVLKSTSKSTNENKLIENLNYLYKYLDL